MCADEQRRVGSTNGDAKDKVLDSGERDGVEQNANDCDLAARDFGDNRGGGVGVCG